MKYSLTILLNLLTIFWVTAQLTIIVDDIPQNTPNEDAIYIAGDFQGWDPGSSAYQLTYNEVNSWHIITLPAETGDINFKFTRGTWPKVESDENGNFINDRFYSPVDGDTIYLQILGWEDLDGGGSGQSTAAENVSIISDDFYMPELERNRRIWIYVPPDYADNNFNYPVLYMHDGQNCFDALTSFIGEWQVDETLNDLHVNGDKGIIVVGIDNGGGERIDEYTPWPNPNYGGGLGDQYINFIVQTLKPYIDQNYRTHSDRNNTGIMGSSLGGLISTYGGIEHQEVFSKIGSFSPSYWFSDQSFEHVTTTGKQNDMRIYQLMGGQEGQTHVDNMFTMQETLIDAGFGSDEVRSVQKSDGEHSEWFWAREFKDAYLWLFNNTTTSVEESISEDYDLKLFPNPVQDKLNLKFYLKKADYIRVEFMDSIGRYSKVVYGNTLQQGAHQLNINIQDRGLQPGLYFCKIYAGQEDIKTLKFIMQ